jgi:hypothetical protein
MPLWSANDDPTGRPNYANNATVYGVDRAEALVKGKSAAPGWVNVVTGTGYVVFNINSGGSGYANTDTIVVDGVTTPGVVNATANVRVGYGANSAATVNIVGVNATASSTVLITEGYANGDAIAVWSNSTNVLVRTINQVVNSTFMNVTSTFGTTNTAANFSKSGVIQSLININPGSGFTTTSNLTLTTSGGVRANVGISLGGRAGREYLENMVIVKGMAGDAADDTIFPDT